MTTGETVGQRLKRARLRLSAELGEAITPPKLAAMIGTTGETIRRYEAGDREPDLGTIIVLAAALKVTPGEIAFGQACNEVPLLPGELPPLPDAEPVPRPVPRPATTGQRRRA